MCVTRVCESLMQAAVLFLSPSRRRRVSGSVMHNSSRDAPLTDEHDGMHALSVRE